MTAIPDRHGCHFYTSGHAIDTDRVDLTGKGERHRRGDIAMSANSQFRHRSRSNQRRATFSAWAMSIVFVAIAMISFAVDQSVVSFGTGGDLGQSLGEFGPVRLIHSLINTAPDHVE